MVTKVIGTFKIVASQGRAIVSSTQNPAHGVELTAEKLGVNEDASPEDTSAAGAPAGTGTTPHAMANVNFSIINPAPVNLDTVISIDRAADGWDVNIPKPVSMQHPRPGLLDNTWFVGTFASRSKAMAAGHQFAAEHSLNVLEII